jgi:hypothetical protein
MRTLRRGLALIGLSAAILANASEEIQSDVAKQALDAYQSETAELAAKHLAAMIAASRKCVQDLSAAKAKVVTEGNVEEGLEIGRLIKRIESRIQNDQARLSLLQPRAVFDVEGGGFELKLLRNSATAYSNRAFVWGGIPEQLDGWQFTQINGGDTPDIVLEIKQAGVVFVAANVTTELERGGWRRLAHMSLAYNDQSKDRLVVLSKAFDVNEKVKITHKGWAGTLVLVPKPGRLKLDGGLAEIPGLGATSSDTLILLPEADGYVQRGQPDKTFSHESSLVLKDDDSGNTRIGYVLFDLSKAKRTAIHSAILRLTCVGAKKGNKPIQILSTQRRNWTESSLTWQDQPGTNAVIAQAPAPKRRELVEFDVTEAVQRQIRTSDKFSIGVYEKGYYLISFGTREQHDEAARPMLVLEVK